MELNDARVMMNKNVFVVSIIPQLQRKNSMEEHGGTKKCTVLFLGRRSASQKPDPTGRIVEIVVSMEMK